MTRRSTAVLLVLAAVLGAGVLAAVLAVGPFAPAGELTALWTSDTERDTRINHHPIGATADGEMILAPVAVPASAAGHAHEEGGRHTHTESTHPAGGSRAPGACQLVSLSRAGGAEWNYTVPPANCSAHAITEPTIGDADDDGKHEAVFATTERAVVILSANGTEERRIPLESYGYGRPTIDDLTPAPGNEIVASDIHGNVVVATDEGVAWRASVGGTVYPAPVVADIDDDGTPELLLGTSRETIAFERDGTVAWRSSAPGWTLATGNVDDDAAMEAFVTQTGALVALDGREGAEQWRRTFDATPTARAVADGDGDGQQEVYVALNGGRLLALDASTGETEWTAQVPTEQDRLTPAPVVGDLTGDGTLEVVGVTNGGGIAVVAAESGRRMASMRSDADIWVRPTLTDLDGDGGLEILIRRGDGRVLALGYSE